MYQAVCLDKELHLIAIDEVWKVIQRHLARGLDRAVWE